MTREMKDSGVEWIGEIPKIWKVIKVKDVFYRSKETIRNYREYPVLKLARSGIEIRDMESGKGQFASDYSNYNYVIPRDILINPMDLISGDNSNISHVKGIISPAYINLRSTTNICHNYYNYYFKMQYTLGAFFANGQGVSFDHRWILNNDKLMRYPLIFPDYFEQQKIANFLDKKTSEIDSLISNTEKSIELLKEYKQSLITETVTKGLDPNATMKDSGVEWIGEIPEHWQITKMKNIYKIKNGREIKNENGDVPVYGSGGQFKFTDKTLYNNPSVLFGRKGTIGKPLFVTNPFWTVDTMFYTETNKNIVLSKWLYYFLSIFPWEVYTTKTTIPSIVGGEIEKAFGLLVPLDEQEKIVNYLDKKIYNIDELINKKTLINNNLISFKQSLIYEYVTGKKEVPDGY